MRLAFPWLLCNALSFCSNWPFLQVHAEVDLAEKTQRLAKSMQKWALSVNQGKKKPWAWSKYIKDDALHSRIHQKEYVDMPEIISLDWSALSSSQLASSIGAMLNTFGAVVLPEVLPKDRSKLLAEYIFAHVHNKNDTYKNLFGEVANTENTLGTPTRFDKPILLDAEATPAGRAFTQVLHLLGETYAGILGTKAKLAEFSALVPTPGADAQDEHSDQGHEGIDYRFLTTFLYSNDVLEQGGALDVWLGTHSTEFYDFHSAEDDEHDALGDVLPVRIVVPAGSLVIYDARILHRGSAYNAPSNARVSHTTSEESCDAENPSASCFQSQQPELGPGRAALYWTWQSDVGADPLDLIQYGCRMTFSIHPKNYRFITLDNARKGQFAVRKTFPRLNIGCRKCHETCLSCKTDCEQDPEGPQDVCGESDCVSCPPGSILEEVFGDGTGRCIKS